ncbi:MAG: MMPL family transporter, partial [Deinococcus sp.]|nr:MMPL family transporter [Deinococcus sp.]
VLGIFDPRGILNPETLGQVYRLSQRLLALPGIVAPDVWSLPTVDNVTAQGTLLRVAPLLESATPTQEEITALRRALTETPLFTQRLLSADGQWTAIYLPVADGVDTYHLAAQIRALAEAEGVHYALGGQPLAEDTFGTEMFQLMLVLSPLIGLVIFLGLWFLFRHLGLILAPMMVALLSVIWTMGLMIGLGFPVHIMSSMAPVFLMAYGVGDGIHLLSEYHDRRARGEGRIPAVRETLRELWTPVLYTSLTTVAGFASMALTPIPPVQIFGLFVAFGLLVEWLLSVTLVPAMMVLVRERRVAAASQIQEPDYLARLLERLGWLSLRHSRWVVAGGVLVLVLAVGGISRIQVNDNPVRWFKPGSPVRQATEVLNQHFGGTYLAYLVAEADAPDRLREPAVLNALAGLQQALEELPVVGKTTSLADYLQWINRALHQDDPAEYRVPASKRAVAQELLLFLSSGGGRETLDKVADLDYQRGTVWVQLTTGDNLAMAEVEQAAADYLAAHPLPGFTFRWAGLTYLSKVWQDTMVWGMLSSLLGAVVVVLVLLVLDFQSLLWGVLGILPLACTIAVIYGLMGWVGKSYDMPIAVLSSLSLGMGVDFAIHYIQRFREHYRESGDLAATVQWSMGAPARAILRNALVLTLGFVALWFAPLTPYVTVGVFVAGIMLFGSLATLLLLPALIQIGAGLLLRAPRGRLARKEVVK